MNFKPSNKFIVPIHVELYEHEKLQVRKFLNLHYLGDEDANELVDDVMTPMYPEKETEEYKNATAKIRTGWHIEVSIMIDTDGNIKCEVIQDTSPESASNCWIMTKPTPKETYEFCELLIDEQINSLLGISHLSKDGQALTEFKQELKDLYSHLDNLQSMKTSYLSGR